MNIRGRGREREGDERDKVWGRRMISERGKQKNLFFSIYMYESRTKNPEKGQKRTNKKIM